LSFTRKSNNWHRSQNRHVILRTSFQKCWWTLITVFHHPRMLYW
jgi:hypothetical protein